MTGEDSRWETPDDCVTEGCWRDVGPGVGLELAAIVLGAAERWEEVAERGAVTRARCRSSAVSAPENMQCCNTALHAQHSTVT